MQQFLINQPSFPRQTATDPFYLRVADDLYSAVLRQPSLQVLPPEVLRVAALGAVGYLQDIVADSGVWRGFISEHRRLYFGRTLPFYETGSEYIDFELNREDVRFIVWYTIAMTYEPLRLLDPEDGVVSRISELWWEILERNYDDAPVPEEYHLHHELEMHAAEEAERVARLAHWLYLHCWLLKPANALTLSEVVSDLGKKGPKDQTALAEALERAMNEYPTGPLALFLRQWLWLIVEDRMPPKSRAEQAAEREAEANRKESRYYAPFTSATGGRETAYFATYGELNEFFIRVLGWAQGEEHLSQFKQDGDFALKVDKYKGMLLARNVARCIADPDNRLYDSAYARDHAIELLTERGRCPIDLLTYVCRKGWLPDARFPHSQNTRIVSENWDFIARCYLQQYYTGD